MSAPRGTPRSRAAKPAEERLREDLRALGAESERETPVFSHAVRRIERRMAAREGWWMRVERKVTSNRWWIPAAVTVALATALLFVPFSYHQQVGHRAALTIADGSLDPTSVREIGDAFAQALGTEGLRIRKDDAIRFEADVPLGAERSPEAVTRAFAAALEGQGLPAQGEVTPWLERVSGNVYAYGSDLFQRFTVPTQGRSDAEVEADLRAQLESAGLFDLEVRVQRDGNRTQVEISADGHHSEIHMEREEIGGGPAPEGPLELRMLDPEKLRGKSDAEIQALIEEELRREGIDAQVSVQNGEIRVEARKEVHE